MTKSIAERRTDSQCDNYIEAVMYEWVGDIRSSSNKRLEMIYESLPGKEQLLNMVDTSKAKGKKVRFYNGLDKDDPILKAVCLDDYFFDAHGVENRNSGGSKPIFENIETNESEVLENIDIFRKRIFELKPNQLRLLCFHYVQKWKFSDTVKFLMRYDWQEWGPNFNVIKYKGVTVKYRHEAFNKISKQKELKKEIDRASKELCSLLNYARYG